MSILIREKGAAALKAAYGYNDTKVEDVHNDYDQHYPWNQITIHKDPATKNVWIRIPKFYTFYKTDSNGYVTARYISQYNVSKEWHLNPIFIGDNGAELPYIELGAYLNSYDQSTNTIFSIPGVHPVRSRTIDFVRNAVEEYDKKDDGYNYELYNIWAAILEQDLFLIEYANSDTSKVLAGTKYSTYRLDFKSNGATDNIPYHTGTQDIYSVTSGTESMKYRGLENVIGNGHLLIDGITINKDGIYVKTAGKTLKSSLVPITEPGYVDKLGYDPTTKLIFPVVANAKKGSYGDVISANNNDNQIVSRGINTDEGYGLFCYSYGNPKGQDTYSVTRMLRKPDIK